MFSADDAQKAVGIFLDRRPLSLFSSSIASAGMFNLPDDFREQSDAANAQLTSARAEVTAVEEPAPAALGGVAEEDDVDVDIKTVFDEQIDDMKKQKDLIDPKDLHRAAVVAEIERLERLRLELIEKEKQRQRLLAEQQATRDAAEKKHLQHIANQLQQEKERRLREERERQQKNERLRTAGNCPNGYSWRREGNGYRCEGGAHFVSDDQLCAVKRQRCETP
jgi:hypothetical protein